MRNPRNPYSATQFCLLLGVAGLLVPVLLYVVVWLLPLAVYEISHPRKEPTTIWEAARDGNLEVLDRELRSGADPNAPDRQWNHVPLYWAGIGGDSARVEIVARLLEAGADPKVGAPLLQAAGSCNPAVTRQLLAAGADPSQAPERGVTALHVAANNDCVDVMQLLIAGAADVNARDGLGFTPLHFAAGSAKVDAVRALLDAGADRTIADNEGRTPYDFASPTTGELAYWFGKVRKLLRE